jgi:hypothetical protein
MNAICPRGHLALISSFRLWLSGWDQRTLLLYCHFVQNWARWGPNRGWEQVSRIRQKWLYQVREMVNFWSRAGGGVLSLWTPLEQRPQLSAERGVALPGTGKAGGKKQKGQWQQDG